MTEEQGFSTRAIHAGQDPDSATGSVVPPIYATSTFIQDGVGGVRGGYEYSRSANPTRTALEECMAALEGGRHGFAFASGLAAEDTLLRTIASPGSHFVVPSDAYGGTFRLFSKVHERWGVTADPAPLADLAAVEAAITPRVTTGVWIETPTNPKLAIADIAAISELAHAAGALVIVDNTFASPYLQQPLGLGADVVVHSTTKYLGGHSDTIGGAAIVRDAELHERVRFVQNSIGAVPGPLDCFLVHRGLRTLYLRVAAHDANGLAVSSWLHKVAGIADVRWPGFGGMVCFRHPDAVRIASSTRIFSLAESLGGVESLIEVPQAMTHQSVEGSSAAVPADLVRLSCGVEAGEDLIADLAQAIGVPVAAPAQASLHA